MPICVEEQLNQLAVFSEVGDVACILNNFCEYVVSPELEIALAHRLKQMKSL